MRGIFSSAARFLLGCAVFVPFFVGWSVDGAAQNANLLKYAPPENSRLELEWLKDRKIQSLSVVYSAKFSECDKFNTFGGK